jgi:dTDP-4-amino-4,6-dideoxygalactose transaminase
LPRLDGIIARRRAHAERYRQLLERERTWFVDESAEQFNSYHLFVVQSAERDALSAYLRECGIGSKIHYPVPIHLQPAAERLGYRRGSLPETERQAARILSIPIHQFLSDVDLVDVAGAIDAYFNSDSR